MGISRVSTLDCFSISFARSLRDNDPNLYRLVSIDDIVGTFNAGFSAQGLEDLERAVVQKDDTVSSYADSLATLLNLALREDETGKRAERFAFDLFSGKTGGMGEHADIISRRCLEFYDLAQDLGDAANAGSLRKMGQPSHLCYMAGAALGASASQREEIARLFPVAVAQGRHEQVSTNDDMWCNDRMVGTDEIAAALRCMEAEARDKQMEFKQFFSFNFPIHLYIPETGENMLKTQLLLQSEAFMANDPYHPFRKINIFIVNQSRHWMLFATYPESRQHPQDGLAAVVFSSTSDISPDVRKAFHDAAELLDTGEVRYVTTYLQKHVNNGCGLLVVEAIRHMVFGSGSEPLKSDQSQVLAQFSENFLARSAQAQQAFNTGKRREMYGDYIEVNRYRSPGRGMSMP